MCTLLTRQASPSCFLPHPGRVSRENQGSQTFEALIQNQYTITPTTFCWLQQNLRAKSRFKEREIDFTSQQENAQGRMAEVRLQGEVRNSGHFYNLPESDGSGPGCALKEPAVSITRKQGEHRS